MKILHILAQLPGGTGSGVYFVNLIKEFSRYGHEQCAVFALQDQFAFSQLPVEKQFPVRFKTHELPFPVPGMSDVMPYDSTRYSQMSVEMIHLWQQAFDSALKQAAASFQPDILILHHLWMLTSMSLEYFPLAKSIGVCHNTDLRQAEMAPRLFEKYVTNITRLDWILSLGDDARKCICSLYHYPDSKIVTVGGGYDSEIFYPAKDRVRDGVVRILYAGKIDPSKGIFELLQAFSNLSKQDGSLRLTVVGTVNQEYRDQFNRLVDMSDNIRIYPAVSQAALAHIMRGHNIFVMPSYFEGLGLVAIEALACGLWTVSTEIQGLMSQLGEQVTGSEAIEFVSQPQIQTTGVLHGCQRDQLIEALSNKMLVQIKRVQRRNKFPALVRDDISRHSWNSIATKINNLLS